MEEEYYEENYYEEEYYEEPAQEPVNDEQYVEPEPEYVPEPEPAPEQNYAYGTIVDSYVPGSYYICGGWTWYDEIGDWFSDPFLSDAEAANWVESSGYMKPSYPGTDEDNFIIVSGIVYLG